MPTKTPIQRALARAKHLVGHRIAYKMNDKGEHVVALIFPPQPR